MLRKFYNLIWGLKRYERMLRVPRQYANQLDLSVVDPDAALIMGRSSARSAENVRALMKLHNVKRVEELLDILPDQHYRRNPMRRLMSLLRSITGSLPYNPAVRNYNRLARKGHFARPDLHERIRQIGEFK